MDEFIDKNDSTDYIQSHELESRLSSLMNFSLFIKTIKLSISLTTIIFLNLLNIILLDFNCYDGRVLPSI